ncbi:hypothetical protein FRB95_008958 [Tulasnella sp. JGI-2019a]|nr:hypothetical protein FRB95_008958 [Tulasnella sp. JGI-2019a]
MMEPTTHNVVAGNLQVSTAFFPAADLPGVGGMVLNTIIATRDGVIFYVHSTKMQASSCNSFDHLIPASTASSANTTPESGHSTNAAAPPADRPGNVLTLRPHPNIIILIPELAAVCNVLLHIVYGMSCERFLPSIETFSAALQCLRRYGISIPDEDATIWTLIANHAPEHPMQVYLIGATYLIESVCVLASPYTLYIPVLQNMVDQDAIAMGAIYLRRLLLLHAELPETLRRITIVPPKEHVSCTVTIQEAIPIAWRDAVANLLRRPQIQATRVDLIEEVLGSVVGVTHCGKCNDHVRSRVVEVTEAWAVVQRTI